MGTERLRGSTDDQPGLPELLSLIDAELGNVFAFIMRRCADRALAEDLTAEVILSAVRETKRARAVVTPAWLTTVARNRMIDHWRAKAREERRLRAAWSNPDTDEWTDDGTPVEPEVIAQVMRTLPPGYQAVLSLRYLDDLPVPQVADALGRSVHATESLLARARRAFRTSYLEHTDG